MSPYHGRVGGFSVLEAIIVLAITGLALTLVFSIGSRGSEMGFRLGRRALSITESQIAKDSIHTVIGGFVLPPLDRRLDATSNGINFSGDERTIAGLVVASRATPCASAGIAGRVTLKIIRERGHSILICQAQGRNPVSLSDLGLNQARFRYSEDGTTFADHWEVKAGEPVPAMRKPSAQERAVFIEIANDDGSVLVATRASSGRPIPWLVFDPSAQ